MTCLELGEIKFMKPFTYPINKVKVLWILFLNKILKNLEYLPCDHLSLRQLKSKIYLKISLNPLGEKP